MASSDLMVGLEIGTSKICVVVGEGRPDGTIKILGVGQAPSRGVRKGEIVDFETAMKCVHEAVVDAETKSDVMIRSVYVGVAGSHIQSFNNRGCVSLPEDRDEIDEQDIEDVKINAREVSIPAQNAFCIRSSSIITSMGRTVSSIRSGCSGKNSRRISISSTACERGFKTRSVA